MPIRLIDPDYEPEETQFESYVDGKYPVSGLTFFTKDDSGNSIFVAQSGNRMVARYRTVLEDGGDGPPGSVDRGEVPLLVRAFGGDVSELPPYNQPNRRLSVAETLINDSEKVIIVNVSNGWINSVPGMQVKPDYYRFKYGRIMTNNQLGEPSWITGQYGPFAIVAMDIVGDAQGNPSSFDQVRVRSFLNYPLSVVDGELTWDVTKSGSYTASSWRFSEFARKLCGHEFFSVSFEDESNVMPELHDLAVANGSVYMGIIEKDKKGRSVLNLGSLQPVGGSFDLMGTEVEEEEVEMESDAVQELYKVIEKLCPTKAFAQNGKLTSEAVEWWKTLPGDDPSDGELIVGISALCKKHDIPHKFADMDATHVSIIIQWMEGSGNDEF